MDWPLSKQLFYQGMHIPNFQVRVVVITLNFPKILVKYPLDQFTWLSILARNAHTYAFTNRRACSSIVLVQDTKPRVFANYSKGALVPNSWWMPWSILQRLFRQATHCNSFAFGLLELQIFKQGMHSLEQTFLKSLTCKACFGKRRIASHSRLAR
jgi:hypothetical protein